MISRKDYNRLVELLTQTGADFYPTTADCELVWKFERYERTGKWGEWWEI